MSTSALDDHLQVRSPSDGRLVAALPQDDRKSVEALVAAAMARWRHGGEPTVTMPPSRQSPMK